MHHSQGLDGQVQEPESLMYDFIFFPVVVKIKMNEFQLTDESSRSELGGRLWIRCLFILKLKVH